jgi:hypothetical protein
MSQVKSGQTITGQNPPLSALIQKRTHALQHDRRKQKDRQCGGLSEIKSGVVVRQHAQHSTSRPYNAVF